MAAYKALIGLAPALDAGEQVQNLLQQTLEEEEEADRKLAEVAEGLLGEAEAAGGESEDEDVEMSSTSRRR